MRQCPACAVPLVREEYEGFPVWGCGRCRGRLVGEGRIEAIKRKRGLGTSDLMREVVEEKGADTGGEVRCPKCRLPMEKEAGPHGLEMSLDVCRGCRLVWFDGGELALVQLAYEGTAKAKDDVEFRRRLNSMDPERRARFEANLARLREGPSDLTDALGEGLVECLVRNPHLRGTWWSRLF